ncbi:MAG TPA: cell division protein ZapE [Rhodospirillaceae bacterium]|nr:cell division protein ZapE [Rhodospirillaceae bacterium]
MPITPLDLYRHRLAKKEIQSDPYQESAVRSLQRLHGEIIGARQKAPKGFFQSLFGFGASKKEAPKGVYMYGGVGRGKSMLMDLFYECLPADAAKRRIHFHQFMIEAHNYMHERRSGGGDNEHVDELLPSLAERISERSRVLCFDEFHVTDVADAMILGRLFTALFDRGVVVVATSNWPPDRLYEGGLQRERFLQFIELLKRKMEVVPLEGPVDYRAQCMQREGTYFCPLGRGALEKAEAVFMHLTQGSEIYTDEIEVKGRIIPVRAVAKGVARFTFAQLCEQPHGAEDYLAIAARYRAVFLEGVPRLGYDRRNEAKRLMLLIDALYENGTKLLVTADAPPQEIYRGHDHEFEFQRTVSRLLEMQSEKYLNA